MKTSLIAIGLALLIMSVPRGACAAGGYGYQAFWLTPTEKGNEFVDLVLSRRPLAELVEVPVSTHATILDSDAVVLTTWAKDSIWNIDRQPIKTLRKVEKVKDGKVAIAGQVFTWTQADLKDVARILEHPDGSILLHRKYAAAAGQEDEIAQLAKANSKTDRRRG